MNYTWNWGVLWQSTGVGDSTYLSWILIGLGWLVVIAIVAWSIAMVLGSILGIMRTLPNKTARAIGTGYVTIFRNVPLLIQLFIWFYVVPNFLPGPIKSWWINDLSAGTTALISASIGLGLFTAARVCEQVRTGIEALPTGQVNAGYAVGFSTAPLCHFTAVLPYDFAASELRVDQLRQKYFCRLFSWGLRDYFSDENHQRIYAEHHRNLYLCHDYFHRYQRMFNYLNDAA